MRRIVKAGAVLALALSALRGPGEPASPPAPESWCLYYGGPVSNLVERLAGYDLAVLDPAALGDAAKPAIDDLHRRGRRVLGYFSAVEVAPWHGHRGRVPDAWLIRGADGAPWLPWAGSGVGWSENRAASLAEPGWRALLADLVEREVLGAGCDGVFLDTLEDLDRDELPEAERARQREGLALLLDDLRRRRPDAPVFANRTLGATLDAVAAHGAAGVCWEDFAPWHFADPASRPWMEGVAARLAAIRRKRPDFAVLALWNEDARDEAAERAFRGKARELGFLPFASVGGYGALPPPAPPRAPAFAPAVSVRADHAGRSWWAEVEDPSGEALSYAWRYPSPDGAGRDEAVTASPRFRRRMPEGARAPFGVELEVALRGGGAWRTNLLVEPPARPLAAPFPDGEIAVGICGYDDPTRLVCEIVTNGLCDLYVHWSDPKWLHFRERLPPEIAEKAHRDGLRAMTIYGRFGADEAAALRAEWGDRWLGDNVGEHAGYLYQREEQARAAGVPQDLDVLSARDDFVGRFVRGGPGRDDRPAPFVFSTSGSPLAAYELEGGIDFICNELYAVGSANLAYATSEARGAARRWGPPFWGSWLAEEWQTFPIPYGSSRKYELLKAGFLQQWVMGTSLLVLESGAQHSQAHVHTAPDPVLDPDGRPRGKRDGYRYDDLPPRSYRAVVKEFRDFVRARPRPPGGPDTRLAFALGGGDAFVGMTTDWFAVWGQHAQAATNALWRCGPPEETWLRVQDRFFPRPQGALAPFPNHWLAGSPFGQVDVVPVDDESRLSDLSRYRFLAFAGWNTMTPGALRALDAWVRGGGTLALAVPHLSSRRDRDWRGYAASDCLPAPGGVRVAGDPETVAGRVETTAACPAALRDALAGIGEASVRLAPLDLSGARRTDVVATLGGRPLIVRVEGGEDLPPSGPERPRPAVGRCVYLLCAWDYPGRTGPLADVYDALLRTLAAETPQRVRLAPVPGAARDDTRAVCYAVYGDRAYLLNVDCAGPRAVDVLVGDAPPRRLELAPLALETVGL